MNRQICIMLETRRDKRVLAEVTRYADLTPRSRTGARPSRIVRLLWWLLGRTSILFHQERIEWSQKTVAIDQASFFDMLQLTQREMEAIWRKQARYIAIGEDAARALIDELACHSFMTFDLEMQMRRGESVSIRGVQVILVPWMRGVCVLPELNPGKGRR